MPVQYNVKDLFMNKFWKVVFIAGVVVSSAAARLPNVVLLLADDLGYGDLGIQGAADVATPHIDALFRSGMQFKEAYVAYPACGPSRASIMTGRHHMRMGFPSNPDHIVPTAEGNLLGLPHDEVTLADLLKKEGYATGLFGKWHLGFQKANHPLNRGFDEYFGFLGSLYRYFDLGNMKPPHCMMRGFDRVHEKEYQTDAIARESVDFIGRHKEESFLLFTSFGAVHTPLMYDTDPGNKHILLAGTDDVAENRRMMVNMIEGLDRGVGAVMAKLGSEGLLDDTLVFFLSDNGGTKISGAYNNGELRGWKGQLFEGGMRVPMAVSWKGRIDPGQSHGFPVMATDFFATAVAASGGTLPIDREYNSMDLMPVLLGKSDAALHADEALCWDALGMQAVRRGDWKLVMRGGKSIGLYNIPADAGEKNNLLAAYPERVERLQLDYQNWKGTLPAPAFKWVGPEKFAEWEKENGKQW